MDTDLEDPNNHVPPVSPEDEWGDLDELQDTQIPGQPSERPDRGIPPRKESRKPHLNHHYSRQKRRDDSSYSPLEQKQTLRDDEETLEKSEKPFRKPASKTAIKIVNKAAKQEVDRTSADSVAEPLRNAPATFTERAEGAPERIVLPPSQGAKRLRVKEIGAAQEPAAQRVPKMYPNSDFKKVEKTAKNAALPQRRFSRGERADWGEKGARGSLQWMLYTGIGVVALVVVAVVLSDPSGGNKSREKSMFSQLVPEETDAGAGGDDSDMMAMLTAGQEEAKGIFAKYATAKSTADFMGILHRPEEVSALVEERWEPLGVETGWKPDDQAVWMVMDQHGSRYGSLEGGLPNFSSFRAFFRQDGDALKMDWKATVGYCSSDFATLRKGQGDGSEVRAWLSPADFHTFPLPEGEFRAFRLGSPDGQDSLWGYAKVDGELDAKLIAQFMPSQITGEAQTEVAVVVSLERGPTESLPNQWMITNLVRLNWLDE